MQGLEHSFKAMGGPCRLRLEVPDDFDPEPALQAAEAEVLQRLQTLTAEEEGLQRELEMLEDPVYQERVRRSLLDPNQPPLTLARARRLAGW